MGWTKVIVNWDTLRINDTILGIACVVLLLGMRELKNITWFKVDEGKTRCQIACNMYSPKVRAVLEKVIWLTSVGRNAIVVVVCALIAYACDPELPDVNGATKNTTFILT